jgi:hypothetical protein
MMVREEVIRSYDGKVMVWERRNMPELVQDYKRILKKDYYDPHFWVLVEVREGNGPQYAAAMLKEGAKATMKEDKR